MSVGDRMGFSAQDGTARAAQTHGPPGLRWTACDGWIGD